MALWGIEAQGLAPRYRIALRQALATHLRHHAGGLLDSTYDLHSNKYIDPGDQVILHHIKAMHTLYHNWPPEQIQHLEQAWAEIYYQLSQKQHPWYVVKGPMAATIAYMLEWRWQVHDIHRWHRPSGPYLVETEIDFQDPWWKLERALLQEAKAQRTARLASKEHHQHLVAGLDWMVPTSTREATNKSSRPSSRDSASTNPTPLPMPATPAMHCGKKETKSHAASAASPCTWMVSSGSSSQGQSKSLVRDLESVAHHR